MRVLLALVFVCAMLGCDSGGPKAIEIGEARVERTYRLTRCFDREPPACAIGQASPHHSFWMDSATLQLHGNGTAVYTRWTTHQSNPCVGSGGSPSPCVTPPPSKTGSTTTGTYTLTTTGVLTSFPNDESVTFAAELPPEVPTSWAGPDSLVIMLLFSVGTYPFVFTPVVL